MTIPSSRRNRSPVVRVMGSATDGPNPFVQLMADALVATGDVEYVAFSRSALLRQRPDIWHINWPEAALRAESRTGTALKAVKLLSQLWIARKGGVRIVWTVHNLRPHRLPFPGTWDWFLSAFMTQVDLYVHLSEAGGRWFREEHPSTASQRQIHLRHPRYPIVSTLDRRQARIKLGLPDDVSIVAIPGRVRAYKNVPRAIRAFVDVAGNDELLFIAGDCDDSVLQQEIAELSHKHGNVSVRLEDLTSEELQLVIRSSDLVLLPHNEFLNSGLLLLVLSVCRRVLVRSTPVTEEVRTEVGERWIITFEDESDLREKLRDHIKPQTVDDLMDSGPLLDAYTWSRFADTLIQHYRELIH